MWVILITPIFDLCEHEFKHGFFLSLYSCKWSSSSIFSAGGLYTANCTVLPSHSSYYVAAPEQPTICIPADLAKFIPVQNPPGLPYFTYIPFYVSCFPNCLPSIRILFSSDSANYHSYPCAEWPTRFCCLAWWCVCADLLLRWLRTYCSIGWSSTCRLGSPGIFHSHDSPWRECGSYCPWYLPHVEVEFWHKPLFGRHLEIRAVRCVPNRLRDYVTAWQNAVTKMRNCLSSCSITPWHVLLTCGWMANENLRQCPQNLGCPLWLATVCVTICDL